mgnify:FL=1
MINSCLKLILLFSAIVLLTNLTYSQTDEQRKQITASYNQELLKELADNASKTYNEDLKKAEAYARANNIPTVITSENGELVKLTKILDDGTLLYLTTHNRGAGVTARADKLYTGGGLNLAVEGEGMLLGVWDGGRVLENHTLLSNRVTQIDDPDGYSNHATHVAGTMIGRDLVQGGDARGMSFRASLNAYDFGNDFSEMTTAAANGLLISNHSYGFDADALPQYYFGSYDNTAAQVDFLLYNAPYYTAVFSAGNDRNAGHNPGDNGYDILTDRGVSKNGITVAAVGEVLNYTGPSSVNMSSFSSWGPTDDNRIKPDISAKGVNLYSSFAISPTSYGYLSGTSMATPSVSGTLGLLQELNSDIKGTFMKSATVKALMIHTASEAGNFDGPDPRFGWGLINAEAAAEVILNEDFQSLVEENILNNGGTYTKTVTALGTEPLVVTIAWTDPAGSVQGAVEDDPTPRLVNDLDIQVVDNASGVNYPWRLSGFGFAFAPTKGVNSADNVEKVEINAPSGDYTIIVNHKGSLQSGSQDFSLIATGISESDIAFTPDNLSKIYCSNEVAEYYFNYSSNDSYIGPTTLSATGLPAGAIATFIPEVITADEDFVLQISGLESVSEGTYAFNVVANGPSVSKTKEIELTVNSANPLNTTTLTSPSDGAVNVYINPDLMWTAVTGADSYTVQVSETSDFNFILFEAATNQTILNLPGLSDNTQYYWRVSPISECVTGDYVSSSFITETLVCSIDQSAIDTPITITQVPNEVNSVITIPAEEDILVGDVNVSINLTHTWLADLTISLVSPSGTEVVIINNACGEYDNIIAVFDESGSDINCLETIPSINGIVKPQNSFSPFIGENAAGDWTLRVVDGYNQDGGALNGFSLELCSTAGPLSVADKELEGFVIYPNPAKNHFEFTLLNQQENVKVGVYDINGRLLISKSFNTNERKLVSVENLSNGMYFVEVINGQQKGVKKLMVK